MPSFQEDCDDSAELARHMKLLGATDTGTTPEMNNVPIFHAVVKKNAKEFCGSSETTPFTQYGLLAGILQDKNGESGLHGEQRKGSDPRLFYNVATPSSVFICGSQGSGKSHTLSCLLENCLLPSHANVLPRPLTGVVFHYDTFNSDIGGTPSEAAYLSSNPSVKVRVLCAPTNRLKIEKVYSCLPNVVVSEFRIHESQLNTKRMLDLMAMGSVAGDSWPLYMHTVTRILRDMRLQQQALGEDGFNYEDFKRRLTEEGLVGTQLGPLQQRLDALESFMVPGHATKTRLRSGEGNKAKVGKFAKGGRTVDKTWTPKESDVGRVVALDEAHKYMTGSMECETLTERLLSAIRLQRHLAARVFISTQEPTISPKLLDLCSATIVHRFTSPEWLNTLKKHLAGASNLAGAASVFEADDADNDDLVAPTLRSRDSDDLLAEIFHKIVSLRTGEALLFAPNAAIGVRAERVDVEDEDESSSTESSGSSDGSECTEENWSSSKDLMSFNECKPKDAGQMLDGREWRATEAIRLGSNVLNIRIRQRVTQDGGKSIMAG
ncbi:hypothetical protein PWT90_02805 [Aphanocladium album]|nr:hypothetical protein PWT90_02805 [Aphanocladium album]